MEVKEAAGLVAKTQGFERELLHAQSAYPNDFLTTQSAFLTLTLFPPSTMCSPGNAIRH